MNKQKLHISIVAALRQTIQAHGMITRQQIGSAAKRIEGNIMRCISQEQEIDAKNKSSFVGRQL